MTGERFREHVKKCRNKTCICDKRSIVTVKERGKIYNLNNPQNRYEICQIKTDPCLSPQGAPRCDYLLWVCDKDTVYLVELKGSDSLRAVEQISETLDALKGDFVSFIVNARIVVSRDSVPNIRNTPIYLRLNRKIEVTQGNLLIKTGEMTDKLA
ncbi:MAG: hypothetical protein HQM00_03565 [Magnetococcales bacterium]|nr:hypothetical protein [Magnetococcales bacterium]